MYKVGQAFILFVFCTICALSINAQISVTFDEALGAIICFHGGTYNLSLDGQSGGKNFYHDNAAATTKVEWNPGLSRWEVKRSTDLIAVNYSNTVSDPPCFNAGGWQSVHNPSPSFFKCVLTNITGANCDDLACEINITENTQSNCIDNGSNDYFTATVNASVTNGGVNYQVIVNGTQLGEDTPYGTSITVGNGTNGVIGTFLADGSSVYNIIVRDVDDNSCSMTYTTAVVQSCFIGPLADYVMGREKGTINTCSGSFADSGDLNSDYGNTEDDTLTFCSDDYRQISMSFVNFNIEENNDLLYIYDGPSVGSPQINGSPFSKYGANRSPGTITSMGTCLTFRFTSNNNTASLGWYAEIICNGTPDNFTTSDFWQGYPYNDLCPSAQIGGQVYNDIKNDGINDANDIGVQGAMVALYDNNGLITTTISDDNGEYLFNGLIDTIIYRIEFDVPYGLEVGAHGRESSSTVQFAKGNKCDVDLGVFDPANFCSATDPKWMIPCYINGSIFDPSNSSSTALATFDYSATGDAPAASYNNEIRTDQIGSTWGAAYKKSTKEIYLSAVLKRHSGMGPNGIGAIYSHVIGSSNSSTGLLYDFGNGAGAILRDAKRFPGNGNGVGEKGPCGACDNVDASTFGQIGQVGFGDLDISADEDTLYGVNLFDRKVYSISTNSPLAGSAIELPSQPWLNNSPCSNGIARPWALKVRRGVLYIGVVCDASSSGCNNAQKCNDLSAIVYSFNIKTKAWAQELSFPLNYYRNIYVAGSPFWAKWTDDYQTIKSYVKNKTDAQFGSPIFADIEFDDDGSIIMGFADRTTLQLGYQAPSPDQNAKKTGDRAFVHGDILRAYLNPNTGIFEIENNGVVGNRTSTNPHNKTGIGGKSFYWGDLWYGGPNNAGIGGLAMKWGSQEIMFSVADPKSSFSNGLIWMDNVTGKPNRSVEIYRGDAQGEASTFAKGSGVGDLEILCDPAPIEIGNYVWWDQDKDGLMDPSEYGISNVTIELYKDPDENTVNGANPNGDEFIIATTITDTFGRYVFSKTGNNNNLNLEVWMNGVTKVEANMVYQVRIPDFASDAGIIAFKKLFQIDTHMPTATENQGSNGKFRDNNGFLFQTHSISTIQTLNWGISDHSIDFGFKGIFNCIKPSVTLKANVPCVGESLDAVATVSGINPPFQYNWAGPNGFTSTNPSFIIDSATTLNQGTYYVTVTNNIGCFDTLKMDVYVHSLTSSGVVINNTCGNSNGNIDITAVGLEPMRFDWSHISGNDNQEDLSNLTGGEYEVTVYDANGCSETHEFTLEVINGPSITFNALIDESCGQGNGSIDLAINGETGIIWSHGATSEDVTGLSSGSYTVTVTNGICQTFATYSIGEIHPPSLSFSRLNSTCNLSNGSIDISTTNGTAPFTYNWDHIVGSDNIQDINNLAA
ncbi:MAG: SdrD B-like domain-containing protein, partial [Saprospiraceae bacterium]